MSAEELQGMCELGQRQLIATEYTYAQYTLMAAEKLAWELQDWETLSRLYLPLQETRRQIRQRCLENIICLDLWPNSPADPFDREATVTRHPTGTLLVAGWGTIQTAIDVRALQRARMQYAQTFLGAVYPIGEKGGARAVVIAPLANVTLPPATPMSIDRLIARLSPHCIVFHESQLPRGPQPPTPAATRQIVDLWEQLHAPFLAAARQVPDPLRRMHALRRVIDVDFACELAHQELAQLARQISRGAQPIAANP